MNNKALPLATYLPNLSQLSYGCMSLGGGWNNAPVSSSDVTQTRTIIDTALESGINLFDHADIYTFGKAEQAFGEALKQDSSLRDSIYLQSKCGIRFADQDAAKRYDFSSQWIMESVENILRRLNTEYLDTLLLHRPDPLMETDEVAQAFAQLHQSGKVKHFGVSNMNQHQMRYLQSALGQPLVINQLEMSLAKLDFVQGGIMAQNHQGQHADFDTGTIEYCQANGVQLQSWGSLAQGKFSQRGLNDECAVVRGTAQYVAQLAEEYGVSSEAIVLAFLTRHPANIQPVIGTTNLDRIKACAQVNQVKLTHGQWFTLLEKSLGNEIP
ncbi:aldo/keto reductase [Vibrio breoganii]|uniref:Aldo/keto reductase n=1 Tax=Vibrio breoganii TaxID=553239 RepID=A0ABX1U7B9_9VIBR|nr:aldo/keto reductase [Vibrio breoganii]NMO74549.1 aldo/keto reductase [Vibrio breoganii]NMR70347.1 aldo/keto reductase [Vibrio breoganii]PMG00288.1 aldo/keto reductase [Vibrio breoganii]PML86480.1 aldo/keto reductase [Vibrio breoganii]